MTIYPGSIPFLEGLQHVHLWEKEYMNRRQNILYEMEKVHVLFLLYIQSPSNIFFFL